MKMTAFVPVCVNVWIERKPSNNDCGRFTLISATLLSKKNLLKESPNVFFLIRVTFFVSLSRSCANILHFTQWQARYTDDHFSRPYRISIERRAGWKRDPSWHCFFFVITVALSLTRRENGKWKKWRPISIAHFYYCHGSWWPGPRLFLTLKRQKSDVQNWRCH